MAEPTQPAARGNVTLYLVDMNNQPIAGAELRGSDAPHDIAIVLGKTDEVGCLEWINAGAAVQTVSTEVDGTGYTFEGEIKQSDFGNTLILRIAAENKMENGHFKITRENK